MSRTLKAYKHDAGVIEPTDVITREEPLVGLSRTLRSENTASACVITNYRIRKLTPKECWRLMGFDDADFDKAKASGVSNSQLYKQAGNSIVVNVLEAIFKKLM